MYNFHNYRNVEFLELWKYAIFRITELQNFQNYGDVEFLELWKSGISTIVKRFSGNLQFSKIMEIHSFQKSGYQLQNPVNSDFTFVNHTSSFTSTILVSESHLILQMPKKYLSTSHKYFSFVCHFVFFFLMTTSVYLVYKTYLVFSYLSQ